MLRGLLRFLAYSLAFWFIYRVIVGAFRRGTTEGKKKSPDAQPQRDARAEQPPDYGDVKDARFKDLPGDSSKNS